MRAFSRLRSTGIVAAVFAVVVLVGTSVLLAAGALRTTVNHAITASFQGSIDQGSLSYSLSANNQSPISLTNGTGTSQANAIFTDTRTISASSSENLDLAGVLTDPFGATLTFATIKIVKVCAATTNVNNVQVGGAASNTFVGMFADATDIIAVRPAGCFLWVAPGTGATVTASTGDILKVANSSSGTSVTYDVTLIGTQ